MNIIKRTWNQNRMVNIEDLRGMAFQAEAGGHTFEISGINGAGESVPLSGTVAGVFMRPDGTDVALTGTASDGVVSVTLSDACYAVAGRFGLTIFVTADSKKTCVYACIGTVAQTSYGTVAGDTPQNVVDLINAINAAIASIPADYTDLMAAIAPTYSDQSVYPAGAYRWYNGVLYKSKVAISTAESFTAAHWETVALADDVAWLMISIKRVDDSIYLTYPSSGAKYVSFQFVSGKRYMLTNKTNSSMNAYTRTAPNSSGTNVDTIGTNIASGSSVIFTATADEPAAYLYLAGSGDVVISNIDDGVPRLKLDVDALEALSSTYVQKLGIGQVVEKNTTFFTQTDNILNLTGSVDGYQINQAGTDVAARSGFTTTDYIQVTGINTVVPYYVNASEVVASLGVYYVLYNAQKTPLANRAVTSNSIDVTSAEYIRFSFSTDAKATAMLIKGTTAPTKFIPYGFVFNYQQEEQIVEVYPTDDIIDVLMANKGKKIHFNDGTYDVISIYENHFTNDYFTNYTDYTSGGDNLGRGLPVYRGTKLSFSQGAKFTANYTGNNSNVTNKFSAFALESDVEIDGLTIETSGIRNPIHDDFDNSYSGTTVIKNCQITSDKILIAGGLGAHDLVILENNYFATTRTGQYDVSYHNSSLANAQSRIVIKNNYFAKGMRLSYYGTTTLKTDALINGNSFAYDVTYEAENSSATVDNFELYKWGNTIRS